MKSLGKSVSGQDIVTHDSLNAKLNTKANTNHTHTIAQITNLQASLDAKAPKTHSHTIGDVTGLQQRLNELSTQTSLPDTQVVTGAIATVSQSTEEFNLTFENKNLKTKATGSTKINIWRGVQEVAQYPKQGIFLNASHQAVEENGMKIYVDEVGGQKEAQVALGPKMKEAWKRALQVGTTQELNSVEVMNLGWGLQGWLTRYGQMVFLTAYGNIMNYGNGIVAERLPSKFIPKEYQRFTGICVNNGGFSGAFRLDLGPDGAILKWGVSDHQEYSVTGCYLAKN